MKVRRVKTLAVVVMAAALAGCAKSPASPAGAATVTAPGLASPANGAQIANASQPVTLTINNGIVTTSDAAVSYTFEVATDAAFANRVLTKDAPQTAGQTSTRLDALTAGRDYYWHVRTTAGDTVGVYAPPSKFTIGSAVTLQAPSPVSPASGTAVSSLTPTLIVTNAVRTGPASGPITYRFELAATAAFSPIVVSGTVAEGANQTSFTLGSSLASDATFFWRAQAVDAADGVTSAFSASPSFSTTTTIDLKTVNYQRFVNVSNWPITDTILSVTQDGGTGEICINHTKSGIWPHADFLGDPDTQVEGNQWYFARIGGQWYAGSGEWFRPSQICKGGQFSDSIGPDGTWNGPMDTWVPKIGELVGYMITTPARNYPDSKTLDERSNIVLKPWTVFGVSK